MSVANECNPKFEPGQRITGVATAGITGKRLLKCSAAPNADGNISVAHADAGGPALGVASHDATTGGLLTVLGSGCVLPIDPVADFTAGQEVIVGATGKASPITSVAVAATLTVGSSNSKVKVTAKEAGAAGNALTLTIVDPGGATASLSVDVDNGTDIIVSLARADSAITSTAAEVIAAINEDNTASTLVTAANGASSNGTGLVAAATKTNLAGGVDSAGDEGGAGGKAVGLALSDADESAGDDVLVKLY